MRDHPPRHTLSEEKIMSDMFGTTSDEATTDETPDTVAVEAESTDDSTVAKNERRTEDAVRTDPLPKATPSAKVEDDGVVRVVNPSYEADEDGFVGVDPEYANIASPIRTPVAAPDEADAEDDTEA